MQKVIEFNREAWLNWYFHLNAELRKKTKSGFWKDFFKLMKIIIVGTDQRRSYLVSDSNNHKAK